MYSVVLLLQVRGRFSMDKEPERSSLFSEINLNRLSIILGIIGIIGFGGYLLLTYRDKIDALENKVARLDTLLAPFVTRDNTLSVGSGAAGKQGEQGPAGLPGLKGDAGPSGADGREIEVRATSEAIQWRYVGDPIWKDVIQLDDLRGPQGEPGPQGEKGPPGERGPPGKDASAGSRRPAIATPSRHASFRRFVDGLCALSVAAVRRRA